VKGRGEIQQRNADPNIEEPVPGTAALHPVILLEG
jgi:hypothetical protein